MILRHPNCEIANCKSCLADHEALEEALRLRTGLETVEHLDKYRSFMDKRLGKSSETEWGWARSEVFEEKNIEAYVKSWEQED